MIKGSIVALVTPFKNYDVDYEKLKELIDFHLQNETDGIIVHGTTGECATLSTDEKAQIIKTAKQVVANKIPIIAGTGTNDTRTSIELTTMAKECGADAALVVTPYYNKPSQEGLYRHYQAIARVGLPVIIYNVPSRTGVNISAKTVAELSKLENIIGIKEASGNIDQISAIRTLCDIKIFAGDDSLAFPTMALGGVGVMSVAANIIPRQMAKMCREIMNNNFESARHIHEYYFNLFKALFIETNPVPIKTAMKMMKMLNGEVRPPLTEMSPQNEQELRRILVELELI